MSDIVTVQAVVLSAMAVGEYDKRLVLLTRERGKITAFAKGARRQGSPLMAASNPFVFGSFTLYEGRSSYRINQASISHHFVELAASQPGVYYGFYFLELADYFGQEGNDERELMNLLYVTLRALLNPRLPDALIRCVFELRILVIQGECPELFQCVQCGENRDKALPFFSAASHGMLCERCAREVRDAVRISEAARYTLRFAAASPLERLYTFTVKEEVLGEITQLVESCMRYYMDKPPKSLGILEAMVREK